uniref:CRAL-TRIO domain-containing protein n=1 Tax=Chlamydomonas chlamydogama TaxID=225041 RepID=A0A7S2VVE2_9CHLO|mmetsp:Transcript_1872/g.4163  ORF Transcript_1872/g.4163 Transcript_1872/m.4163 type:complete len:265 (+) Transcript_1872:322-1116(+)|eukprot:CAMPEP_0202901890 /NCGR_PEP_ID=MMETSP1392-20130828/15186_1 /ASSEMBLY_ACC=CAM_ASM_000868 /TAXON_ID=225041 /ORGANISM="Chlamydomonas chlamydogama, Strain SAG 11-48b" /LENGTH=264 /DNA_ID=CAMNT_0049588541 /DNA_START=283 /DNA_END=1077 /DNA_ORIENTATION=+
MTVAEVEVICTEVETRAKDQEVKITDLRGILDSDDGRKAAAQLVQGGELTSADQLLSDQYLRRWLRARRWEPESAARSIIAHAQWRVTNMPTGAIQPSEISNELACGKAFLLGCDKQGRGILLFQARKHNGWTRRLEELEKFCCYVMDKAITMCDPVLNPRGQISFILDLTDMGAVSMDVQAVQALFKLLGEHYVERLGQMVMYNPPYLFWGAWNTLSPLLPPVTKQKIQVLDPTQRQTLVDMMGASVLPTEYGGDAELAAPAQ